MKTVLILGANGRFGRHAAEAFWNAGWRVHLFDRSQDDLALAAAGADVIVNAWNPPYSDWAEQLPSLTNKVIAAAKTNGATVLVPGNVYVFGQGVSKGLDSKTPHCATNPLGLLRCEMEESYKESGVQTIILRAGDFLDTEASGNWFDKVIAPPLKKGVLTYPGRLDVPHAWAYLPDLARAAVALCDRRSDLPAFSDIPFPGYCLTGQDLAELCELVVKTNVNARTMNWLPLQIARPFLPLAKHLVEMRYLWDMPHFLDGEEFHEALPRFVPTAPEAAIRNAISPFIPAPHPPKQDDGGLRSVPVA